LCGLYKRKADQQNKKGCRRSSDKLEIVYTDTSSPYEMCLNGQRYFITFIDDCSRYIYLFLLYDKNEALDAFKIYKVAGREIIG